MSHDLVKPGCKQNAVFGGLLALFMVFPGLARANDVTVDCTGATAGAFTSISAALETLDRQGPHTIFLLPGNCVEAVRIIDRERLTIDASPLGNAWAVSPDGSPPIVISGSHGVTLIQMGATGGNFNGILINRNSEVSILGMTIQNNGGNGVAVRGGSAVLFGDNNISFNGANGVNVAENSVGTFTGSAAGANGLLAEHNGQNGLRCSFGATCFVLGFVTAQNNGVAGLSVSNGARVQIDSDDGPNIFQGNTFAGVAVARNSTAFIFGAQRTFVQNNLGMGFDIEANSSLALFDTTVSNNQQPGLSAVRIALAEFGGNNIFAGNGTMNLSCDSTSLFSGDLVGIGKISCKRIEHAKGPPRHGGSDQ
jgi:hypothetical protein